MNRFIFTFFAFLLFISFGCNSPSGTTNTTATNSAANSATNASTTNTAAAEKEPEIDVNAPFTPSANPKDDLLNATKRLHAQDAFSVTVTNNLFPDTKIEFEYAKPDRYHIKNPKAELIVIGKDGYGREGGKWTKVNEDLSGVIEQMKRGFNADSMKAIKEVKKVGTEKIGGKDANIYEYSISRDKIAQNSTKVWVATDSGLPLKMTVESQQTDATQKQTTTYSYDKNVKIEAPQIQ